MYIYRPVIADPPLCRYTDLIDGTLTLDDVADLNELLDIKASLRTEEQPHGD